MLETLKDDVVLARFTVMWKGWESDNEGVVVQRSGKKVLLLTSHGSTYEAKERELESIIKEHRNTLDEQENALAVLRS